MERVLMTHVMNEQKKVQGRIKILGMFWIEMWDSLNLEKKTSF